MVLLRQQDSLQVKATILLNLQDSCHLLQDMLHQWDSHHLVWDSLHQWDSHHLVWDSLHQWDSHHLVWDSLQQWDSHHLPWDSHHLQWDNHHLPWDSLRRATILRHQDKVQDSLAHLPCLGCTGRHLLQVQDTDQDSLWQVWDRR